ncbi:MAG: hypothetical protein CV089_23915 [Nitrospira sp. WS110]|nr:hypothetical protein [Nitrospira sp. WS110]
MTTTLREAEWGNWGITLYTIDAEPLGMLYGVPQYRYDYSTYREVKHISFPIGAQGPCDGLMGGSQRDGYRRTITQWRDYGIVE